MIVGEPQEAALAASCGSLNPLLAMLPAARRSLRCSLSTLPSDVTLRSATEPMLLRASDRETHVPAQIGDYTDFSRKESPDDGVALDRHSRGTGAIQDRSAASAGGDTTPLPYLTDAADQKHGAFSITLEVHLATTRMRREGFEPFRLSRGPATSMYWTIAQMVTHHTSNACDLRPGGLFGTGTISSPDRQGFGSLLEISRGGTEPLQGRDGPRRPASPSLCANGPPPAHNA